MGELARQKRSERNTHWRGYSNSGQLSDASTSSVVDGSTGSGHRHWHKVRLHRCHYVARNRSNKWWVEALLDRCWKTRGKHSGLTGLLGAQVRGDHESPQCRLTVVNRHGGWESGLRPSRPLRRGYGGAPRVSARRRPVKGASRCGVSSLTGGERANKVQSHVATRLTL